MKKLVAALLSVVMMLSMVPAALAAGSEAEQAADTLHELGLFDGTGTDANGNPVYDLDRAPNRNEAVTMLVRLLGKDSEAKAVDWETPFTDVVEWAKPYVGYAYANGLTTGTSATTFGGETAVSATQYLTFVLRALGYESGADFQWDKAWELSDRIGLTNGEYSAANNNVFLRGDVAVISLDALHTHAKNSAEAMLVQLIEDGAVDVETVLPTQELSYGYFKYMSYQNKIHSVHQDNLMSPSTFIMFDARTAEVYLTGTSFLMLYPFHTDVKCEDTPTFVEKSLWYEAQNEDRTYVDEYDPVTERYRTVYTYTINGRTFQTMNLQEYQAGGYQDGDSGIYQGVRFKVNGPLYYNANDLADYFGLGYHFYHDTIDAEHDCVVIKEI